MDGDLIARLLEIAGSAQGLAQAQTVAAAALARANQPAFPHNGCAATLSALLQAAGINVPMTLGAGRLANILGGPTNSRGWAHILVDEQAPGDVGVTFDEGGNPGADHIYLVLRSVDRDQMIIADNQAQQPHTRFASGRGRTPTEYFLRAPRTALRSKAGSLRAAKKSPTKRVASKTKAKPTKARRTARKAKQGKARVKK
jgi:hypothetical protein